MATFDINIAFLFEFDISSAVLLNMVEIEIDERPLFARQLNLLLSKQHMKHISHSFY